MGSIPELQTKHDCLIFFEVDGVYFRDRDNTLLLRIAASGLEGEALVLYRRGRSLQDPSAAHGASDASRKMTQIHGKKRKINNDEQNLLKDTKRPRRRTASATQQHSKTSSRRHGNSIGLRRRTTGYSPHFLSGRLIIWM